MKVWRGSKDPAMGLQKWLPCATLEQVTTHHEVTYKVSCSHFQSRTRSPSFWLESFTLTWVLSFLLLELLSDCLHISTIQSGDMGNIYLWKFQLLKEWQWWRGKFFQRSKPRYFAEEVNLPKGLRGYFMLNERPFTIKWPSLLCKVTRISSQTNIHFEVQLQRSKTWFWER